ncbi:MAG: hypothetical protein PHH06_01230 [Candidatus Gracilibacteria bacterium]|nr:hypothetical protein [Candidatus Gracilibacteria bacterium]
MSKTKGEYLKKGFKTKDIYYFQDDEKGINQISKESYKNNDIEIHYPIGFEGGEKYSSIKKITFIGFSGKLPV